MTRREKSLAFSALGLGVTAAVLVGFVRLAAARNAAYDAAEHLADSRRMAAQITTQRAAVPIPGSHGPQPAELIRRIESAAQSADFSKTSIERIEPGPAAGVGEGPLREKSTMVYLNGVTLKQLFTFLHAVGTGRSALQLKQIRLTAPSAEDIGEKWSVAATLAYSVRAEEGAVTE